MIQDTLIYVDDNEKLDASVVANTYTQKETKNRSYINTLGAHLVMKYLVSENVDVKGIQNIHSIKKVLEEFDIADIMLPNIHLDVRTVFDDNQIFIPKSHFQYGIVPDAYVVINLAEDESNVRVLGFFEPKLINKNNENSDYYFIEKEKLTPITDLAKFISKFNNNTEISLSENDLDKCETLIVKMLDNDISNDEKQYLLKQLCRSEELRDKFIEYENFETLSYKAVSSNDVIKKDIVVPEEIMQEENSFDDVFNDDDGFGNVPENFDSIGTASSLVGGIIEANDIVEADNIINNLDSTIDTIDDSVEIIEDLAELPQEEMLEEVSLENPEDNEAISINDVEDLHIEEEPKFEQETMPIDNIVVEDIETNNQNFQEEVVSFDNVNDKEIQENPDFNEETVSFEELDIAKEDNIENIFDESSIIEQDIENELSVKPIEDDNIVNSENEQEFISQINDVIDYSSQAEIEEVEEIQIGLDENNIEENENSDDKLDVLFEETDDEVSKINNENIVNDDNVESDNIQKIPGSALFKNQISSNKKMLIATATIATAILVSIGLIFINKPKNEQVSELEPSSPITAEVPNKEQDSILETNTPNIDKTTQVNKEVTKKQVQELKNNVTTPNKPKASDTYLNVSKIVWDVPDVLSYSSKMQAYLRTAGKSIKLSLSADLLLATEYAYTNQVKVNLKIDRNGTVQDARVVSTSGSTQIDNIVLQSVKETLNVVKPPSNEIKTQNVNLSIIIYF